MISGTLVIRVIFNNTTVDKAYGLLSEVDLEGRLNQEVVDVEDSMIEDEDLMEEYGCKIEIEDLIVIADEPEPEPEPEEGE